MRLQDIYDHLPVHVGCRYMGSIFMWMMSVELSMVCMIRTLLIIPERKLSLNSIKFLNVSEIEAFIDTFILRHGRELPDDLLLVFVKKL